MAEFSCGPIYFRSMELLDKGAVIDGHKHNFAHVTLVIAGSVRVVKRGEITTAAGEPMLNSDGEPLLMKLSERVFHVGQPINIEAECHHEITALEDGTTLYCMFTHRDPASREVIQDYNGWLRAYG